MKNYTGDIINIESSLTKEFEFNSEKYKSLISISPFSILILDLNGKIRFANKRFTERSGIKSEDYLGLHFNELSILKGNELILEKAFRNLISNEKSGSTEIKWLNENNETKYSKLFFDLIKLNNLASEIQIVVQDFTEIKLKEKELTKTKLIAEENEKLKTAFLANMSHEVRTPLNGIIDFVNLLKNEANNNPDVEKYIDNIQQSSNNLLDIITDIVEISKLEIGIVSISKLSFNIHYELNRIFDFYKKELIEKKNSIQIYYDAVGIDKNLEIFADKSKTLRILKILIHNAIKFTEKGLIEFGYFLKDDKLHDFILNYSKAFDFKDENIVPNSKRHIVFYVKDTGIGIQKEKQEMIFDRFTQSNEDYKRINGGNGLGLAIAKALIEIMRGDIWVESEPNKGSAFYFSFPIDEQITTDN